LGLNRAGGASGVVNPLQGLDLVVDQALADGGRCLDDLLRVTGASLGDLMRSLTRLEIAGLLEVTDGWFEQGHAPWRQP
jgi:hypothetical protein